MRKFVFALFVSTGMALAHPGHVHYGSGSFSSGFLHPLSGVDHLSVAVAVGLWGAYLLGIRALIPVSIFLASMLGGTLLGLGGVPVPGGEVGALLSIVAMGLLLLTKRIGLSVALPLIALSGIVHGNLHGLEAPALHSPALYVLGLLLSTTMLHLSGMAVGSLMRERYVKLAGAALLALAVALI
ncbi:urease accessory protein [Hydrogenivirga caldilitoris]|uniref:Urease accessory protein n=1 Tax=Hydrogenivirga caldilitoris TaxID=246264 RepID=A0A497XRK5_9AQUI|nr:HupE/UreJ family protein [Hydrogenivirga caldilitoris]RLJ70780.1 urease accessory protein [Hydrogenivirga caldilitoris]